eukprot:scaffold143978_cov60-Attheya_sp.AAC.1
MNSSYRNNRPASECVDTVRGEILGSAMLLMSISEEQTNRSLSSSPTWSNSSNFSSGSGWGSSVSRKSYRNNLSSLALDVGSEISTHCTSNIKNASNSLKRKSSQSHQESMHNETWGFYMDEVSTR